MLRLKRHQRASLAGTLRELANYGAATLIFGQFVGDTVPSLKVFLAGAGVWLVLVSVAVMMEGD